MEPLNTVPPQNNLLVGNGWVNLLTGEFTPSATIRDKRVVNYDASATCPAVDRWLSQPIPHDPAAGARSFDEHEISFKLSTLQAPTNKPPLLTSRVVSILPTGQGDLFRIRLESGIIDLHRQEIGAFDIRKGDVLEYSPGPEYKIRVLLEQRPSDAVPFTWE